LRFTSAGRIDPMQFVSTRGGMTPAPFSDILLEGLAPDGGLVVPEQVPEVSSDLLASWRNLDYPTLAAEVIGLFWTEIPRDDLLEITKNAYGSQFASAVPLTDIHDGMSLVGLSEGPTLAFKDMAMQFLGEAIPYVLKTRGSALNILGATSGDTGSAAEYAFRSKPRIGVFMLSPQGRMSAFQRAQMYSLTDKNIHNITIDGVFDDCQHLVKTLNSDLDFKAAHSLGTVNSINLGRIVAQAVYYFWAWLRATDALEVNRAAHQQVSFSVPSGNFGNIFSGYLARSMGLPIRKLVLATNENNVLEEFFHSGTYAPRPRQETVATSSPSMDISKASNLERFIYDVLGKSATKLKAVWSLLDQEGQFTLADEVENFASVYGFVSGSSTHDNRIAEIQRVHERASIIIDPHTADGVHVAREFVEPEIPMLVFETAKPQKFSDTVIEALGQPAPLGPELRGLLELDQHTVAMSDDPEELGAFISEHAVTA
jgi:threonine synthase